MLKRSALAGMATSAALFLAQPHNAAAQTPADALEIPLPNIELKITIIPTLRRVNPYSMQLIKDRLSVEMRYNAADFYDSGCKLFLPQNNGIEKEVKTIFNYVGKSIAASSEGQKIYDLCKKDSADEERALPALMSADDKREQLEQKIYMCPQKPYGDDKDDAEQDDDNADSTDTPLPYKQLTKEECVNLVSQYDEAQKTHYQLRQNVKDSFLKNTEAAFPREKYPKGYTVTASIPKIRLEFPRPLPQPPQ